LVNQLKVKTSDIFGAGTNANVFLTLFGANGDSGDLELKKSETHVDKFERNQTDVFMFNDMLSLGELSKLRIRHDNKGGLGNSNWHLESVTVEDQHKQKKYTFMCQKWLSLSKDDKQIVRELTPLVDGQSALGTPRPGDKTEYEITVYTADESNSGTKQNVEIVLVGEKNAESKPVLLENTAENKILRRGHIDKILVKLRSVGDIKKIYLAHVENRHKPPMSKEERNADWICYQIVIKDLSSGNSYVVPVMDALGLNKPHKQYKCQEKKENMVNMTRSLKNVKYEVNVVTGDQKGAATGAKVFINIFGEHGDSGKRPLKGKFDRNHTDKCLVECLDLGKIEKVHIEHDNSSFNTVIVIFFF
jgi:hypothetical protein